MGVFGDLNEVKLLGNITQDLELKRTTSGSAVVNFSIATNRSYKMGEEWKEEVSFHNIVVWGQNAEYLVQKAKKGTRLYISGRLQTRKWEDADKKMNYRTEIVADRIILVDRYERTGGQEGGAPSQVAQSYSAPTNSQNTGNDGSIDPDDLPF